MTSENKPDKNSNPTEAEISDQERENALKNFMHPEDKPPLCMQIQSLYNE